MYRAQTEVSGEAIPRAADGSLLCLDCVTRPTVVEAEGADGGGGLSTAAALGVSLGLLALLCCLCCCYVRFTGERALGGIPHKLAEAARQGVGEVSRWTAETAASKKKRQSEQRKWLADKRGVFNMVCSAMHICLRACYACPVVT